MRKYILLSALSLFAAALSADAAFHAQVREQIRDARQELKQFRQAEVEAFKQRREQAQADRAQKREEFQKTIQDRRAEVKDRILKEREQLKERFAAIKDERKKQIVERVARQLIELNERMTNHYVQVLDKLDKALERIGARADKAEMNGRDVSSVRNAINAANAAIAASRAAAETQAGKSYAITVGEENALRQAVQEARRALHNDLSETRKTLKAAHDAVRNAAITLAQIPRVDELEVEPSAATE